MTKNLYKATLNRQQQDNVENRQAKEEIVFSQSSAPLLYFVRFSAM